MTPRRCWLLRIGSVRKLEGDRRCGRRHVAEAGQLRGAIQAGVGKVHLVDGRMPHSLLLEIFTKKGVGTEIIADE